MTSGRRFSNETLGKWALLALGATAIIVALFFWPEGEPDNIAVREPDIAQAGSETAAPEIENPIVTPPQPPETPLPPLADSDQAAGNTLSGLIGAARFTSWFVPDDLIRRMVVTVDNLPREKVAMRLRPVRAVTPAFAPAGADDSPVLVEASFARYEPWVGAAEEVDIDRLFSAYTSFYPLFQQAYEELGNPTSYFNDRLVTVIDHLLATPEVPAPIALSRPNVLYEFADPELERLSAGQKTLVRMGPSNAARIKTLLRQFRERATTVRE